MIQVAVIGVGYFGRNYVRLLGNMPGVRLGAIVARTQESLNRHDLPSAVKRSTDLTHILNDHSIDAVIIATPPSTHLELATAAIQAGKHVLLEKPMVLSLKEATLLKEVTSQSSKVFMVGHQYVYSDWMDQLKKLIEEEKVGRITHVLADHLYPGPRRTDVSCFTDAGTHCLSVIQWLFNPGELIHVRGFSSDFFNAGKPDEVCASLIFRNGLKATVRTCWLVPKKIRTYCFVGTRGWLEFDDNQAKKKLHIVTKKSSSSEFSEFFELSSESVDIQAKESLQNQIEYFLECIRAGTSPRTGISSGCQIHEWIDAIEHAVAEAN